MSMKHTELAPARGPLTGFRILDLSSFVMGPYATYLMADMGADIIMAEPLEGGKNRMMGAGGIPGLSPGAMNLMRNKRSVAVDMKTPEGRDAVLKIALGCDAIVTNLRSGPLTRLGLSYEQIVATAPQLVYCQAVGFNEASERAADPAYDDIIQAECGLADAAQRINGVPSLAPTILADKVCGLMISNSVLSALLLRERERKNGAPGKGQLIKIAMLDVMRAFTMLEHGVGALAVPPISAPGYMRVLSKARGPAQTSDGWVTVMPYSQDAYNALFTQGGRPDLVGSEKTADNNLQAEADYLYHQLKPILRGQSTDFWVSFCKRHGIPVGRITTMEEIISEFPIAEHPRGGSYRVIPAAVNFSAFADMPPKAAPMVGEDSAAILHEAGLAAEQIADLFARGAIKDHSIHSN